MRSGPFINDGSIMMGKEWEHITRRAWTECEAKRIIWFILSKVIEGHKQNPQISRKGKKERERTRTIITGYKNGNKWFSKVQWKWPVQRPKHCVEWWNG